MGYFHLNKIKPTHVFNGSKWASENCRSKWLPRSAFKGIAFHPLRFANADGEIDGLTFCGPGGMGLLQKLRMIDIYIYNWQPEKENKIYIYIFNIYIYTVYNFGNTYTPAQQCWPIIGRKFDSHWNLGATSLGDISNFKPVPRTRCCFPLCF